MVSNLPIVGLLRIDLSEDFRSQQLRFISSQASIHLVFDPICLRSGLFIRVEKGIGVCSPSRLRLQIINHAMLGLPGENLHSNIDRNIYSFGAGKRKRFHYPLSLEFWKSLEPSRRSLMMQHNALVIGFKVNPINSVTLVAVSRTPTAIFIQLYKNNMTIMS